MLRRLCAGGVRVGSLTVGRDVSSECIDDAPGGVSKSPRGRFTIFDDCAH
jgi:hypothetical protein